MRKIFLLTSISFFFLSKTNAQSTIRDSLVSNGIIRYYNLYLSKNYSANMPLIIALHPYTLDAASMAEIADFSPIADTGDFLVVYPEGLKDNSGNPYWNVGWTWEPQTNDLLFISDLIDSLHSRNNIDLNRVYACGISNGAIMSYELATRLSNKIAAIASVSGGMPPNVFDTTVAKRAVPLIEIHGTADATIPWGGSSSGSFPCVAVDTLRKFWLNADQCVTEDSVAIPNINTSDGSTVEQYIFSGGTNGAIVKLYKVIGGQHPDWPGSTAPGSNNEDFNASTAMWNFFKQYSLDQFTGVKPVNVSALLHFYPDPASNRIQCRLSPEWSNTSVQVHITNEMGQLINNYTLHPSSTIELDISSLPSGYYIIQLNNGKVSSEGKLIKN